MSPPPARGEESRPDRLSELDEATCRQLLAARDLGFIAFNADPCPELFPVTYAYRDGDVLFRTAEGTKWEAAERGLAATFEVDGVDRRRRSGWCVVALGRLQAADQAAVQDLPEPLAGGDRPHLVRLSVEQIRGRRVSAEKGLALPELGNIWTGQDGTDLLG